MNTINSMKIIKGKEWFDLKGKEINAPVVVIEECGDIHPFFSRELSPVFKGTHTAYFNRCDKNFIYYWMKPEVFPDLKTIYLNSHPCDPNVFYRFKGSTIYLDPRFKHYKERWVSHKDNVIVNNLN